MPAVEPDAHNLLHIIARFIARKKFLKEDSP